MLRKNRVIILITILGTLIICFLYWYYFVETLKLSKFIGLGDIIVNIIDFDTRLTRYDIYYLSKKSNYWQRRINEVMAIKDPDLRNREEQKLLAEMLEDPSTKRIVKKLMAFGARDTLAILKALK